MAVSESTPLQPRKLSAIPGNQTAIGFARSYREILIQSLRIYFEKIQKSLNLNLETFLHQLDLIDLSRKFSPALFAFYDLLKEGYHEKNIDQILTALQLFKNLKTEEKYCDAVQCETIMTNIWEIFSLLQLKNAVVDDHRNTTAQSIQMLPLVHWNNQHFPPQALKEALELISSLDKGLEEELHAYVTHLKLFAGKVLDSTTSPRFLGAIFLKVPSCEHSPTLIYLRNLVHEISHLHLYAMAGKDPMTLNAPHDLFSSPLRSDKRPMIGIFHATFVLSRMVRILNQYRQQFPHDLEAEKFLAENKKFFHDGLETIKNHGMLSEAGQSIFNDLHLCAFG